VFSTPGPEMRAVVEATETMLPAGAWPLWNGSNHDAGRFPSRWCDGDERRSRAALVILLTLRGTPLLYYGDEIGMRDEEVPRDRLKDPVGVRHWPENPGRDGGRTPMPWTSSGGFTRAGVEPWLPMGDVTVRNAADQRGDPGSMLHLCRDLIALRREREDLHSGAYGALEGTDGVWAWRRGQRTVVAVNHGDEPSQLLVETGEILIGTERARDGERVDGAVGLDRWEAVVIATDD
jgi:alpha-glucosidase